MAKDMTFALLYDVYGGMLTEKQQDMFEQYYHQDLSLAEIAENTDISRQAVRDTVKRAEMQLADMEEHLGFVAKMKDVQCALETVSKYSDAIFDEAEAIGNDTIKHDVRQLLTITEKLKETLI